LTILAGTVAENCTWECIRNSNNLRLLLVILTQVVHKRIYWIRMNLRRFQASNVTVPLNYNFIFAHVYTCGTTRKLQCHPISCLCRPHFLVACNVHVTCRNTRGTKFTHVKQKIHMRTFTHVNYSPDTTRSTFNIASNLLN